MKFPDGLASFGLYLLLPAAIGALSGYIGVHLLFGLVKAIEKWRGRRVAIILMALIFGLFALITMFFFFALEINLSLLGGLVGALVGLAFGSTRTLRMAAILTSVVVGFLLGFATNIYASFYLLRYEPTAEISMLIFNIVFGLVGGILGAVGGGIRGATKTNKKVSVV